MPRRAAALLGLQLVASCAVTNAASAERLAKVEYERWVVSPLRVKIPGVLKCPSDYLEARVDERADGFHVVVSIKPDCVNGELLDGEETYIVGRVSGTVTNASGSNSHYRER